MVGKLVLIFCLAGLVYSGCNFDDSELKVIQTRDRLEQQDGQTGSDYSAVENPKRHFGFSELDGKTVVKYRLRGDGVNSFTRKAVEETMQELQEQVRCLNIEFTKESPQIEPTKAYVDKNLDDIGNTKLNQADTQSMTKEQKYDIFHKGWFEHTDKLNPKEILTIDIDSTPMWSREGESISAEISGNVNPLMRLLIMDRALTKEDQELNGTVFPPAVLKRHWKGTFLHEMFHVFGIAHTQRRDDRDDFISVKFENIQEGVKSQYEKCTSCTSSGPYECNSIMHYDSTSTSKNGKPTMIPKVASCTSFGNDEPTANDWIALRKNLGC